MTTEHNSGWWQDHGEVCTFARVLLATFTSDWSADDAVRYFEKPWRWQGERRNWCAAGQPGTLHECPDLREFAKPGEP